MATELKNLSEYDASVLPDMSDKHVAIVVSEWNEQITSGLLKGAKEALISANCKEENILINSVPGTFELPLAATWALNYKKVDGVIALGSVIRGETAHFDFVCQAASQGIKDVSLEFNKPVIFGVLTDDNLQQAIDRSGGKHGNKGTEAAVACMKMIALEEKFSSRNSMGFNK
ncbi:MAG: 6,7-dimethyl-8-ribityllumazine synthase [Flavobacteriales bacterium]